MNRFGRPYETYVAGGISSMPFYTIHNGFTCEIEAGWVNDKKDKGGETLFGISRVSNPRWAVWPKVDELGAKFGKGTMAFKTNVEANGEFFISAARLFYAKYFMAIRLDEFEDRVACVMYDLAVHAGTERAIIMAQRTYNIVMPHKKPLHDDGVYGPLTRGAMLEMVDGLVETEFAKVYLQERLKWHKRANPEYTKAFTDRCHNLWRFLFGNEMQ